jgi:Protein of unknown function (DUF2793)
LELEIIMTETTARFALPFILPGQAQKEVHHNEALAAIDGALHACVEGDPADAPPADPAPGESWIVGDSPSGAWSGRSGALATWTGGGWRFAGPLPGMSAWHKGEGYWIHWTGTGWSDGGLPAAALRIGGQQVVGPRLPDVPSPSGGTVIDIEARSAIEGLIATLKSHGLIE